MYRLALCPRPVQTFFTKRAGRHISASWFSSETKSAVSVSILSDGVAVIKLDTPNSKVNVLSRSFNEELEKTFNEIEANPNVKASVLISNKPDNFIAGADISMLSSCKTAQELSELSRAGQAMLNRVASGKPVVAAINGSCLGGGLEVALACHYRIASESEKTVFGLPEVKLGLLPGAGGTQRLPRQVGLIKSLDMILTGKNVYPAPAKKLNLVDQLADPFALESAAIAQALRLAKEKPKPPTSSIFNKAVKYLTESFGPVRNMVLNGARKAVLKQTKGKYPAPLKALEAVEAGFAQGLDKGYEVEAKLFGELGMTPVSKALISIYNGSNALKKNPFKEHKPKEEVKTIGVVGAGLMGAGIAGVSVEKGLAVILKDVQQPALARGEKQIYSYFQEKVKKRQLSAFARDRKLSSLIPVVENSIWEKNLPKVDLLIEAVLEELSLKHKVLQQIEPHLPSRAIIATNTSAIPIKDIASGLTKPERLVGMHYFSPVEKMPLLEIILGPSTSLATAAAAYEVGLKQGKTVIVAKDVPGFYVNRSLGPYMAETMALLYQGADIEKIDAAMKAFGMPVGPIALADEVGLDVAFHVQNTLREALGQRMAGGDDSILKEMINQKFLGKKSKKGFFDYSNPKEKKKPVLPEAKEILKKLQKDSSAEQLSVEEIQERLVGRLVNEAIFCLQDKIIETPVVGDIGLVFGIGFPPFLGGPFRYVDSIGTEKFYQQLKRLSAKYGPQFEPAQILAELNGKPFHTS